VTSNLVHNLGSRSRLSKQLLWSTWQGAWLGEHPHNFGTPILISAPVESNDFKFGTQLGFGEHLAKTTFLGQGAPQKFVTLLISATVEAGDLPQLLPQ